MFEILGMIFVKGAYFFKNIEFCANFATIAYVL